MRVKAIYHSLCIKNYVLCCCKTLEINHSIPTVVERTLLYFSIMYGKIKLNHYAIQHLNTVMKNYYVEMSQSFFLMNYFLIYLNDSIGTDCVKKYIVLIFWVTLYCTKCLIVNNYSLSRFNVLSTHNITYSSARLFNSAIFTALSSLLM